jgi:hypothetical protein
LPKAREVIANQIPRQPWRLRPGRRSPPARSQFIDGHAEHERALPVHSVLEACFQVVDFRAETIDTLVEIRI